MIDHGRRIVRMKNTNGRTRHLLEHLMLIREVMGGDRVVQEMIRAGIVRVVAA
jgi:hypothetical protein